MIIRKITQFPIHNQKSDDLDKNLKSNQNLKLREIFVSRNDFKQKLN